MSSQKFDVMGMTCSACSAHVDKSVRKLPGVKEVNVNLLANNMTVEYDPAAVDENAIIKAVQDGGYDAVVHQKQSSAGKGKERPVDTAKAEIDLDGGDQDGLRVLRPGPAGFDPIGGIQRPDLIFHAVLPGGCAVFVWFLCHSRGDFRGFGHPQSPAAIAALFVFDRV